ncbi:MAG TPA: WYL domain-containing protein [Pusillimonas sp.]|jgi:predicted DNA-binding transcriptional regulator YafY|nr:WYL domain-containing protein [Pusillimonas sp.]|tara:strand:+ start:3598 stop:4551 length:954 start_codon:yes stop_codon:yes gene_type:complete
MATRSNNLDTVNLTLEILKRISRNRAISAAELHAQLLAVGINRSRRTIERRLGGLVEQFDIECDDRSKPYGYRWKSHSKGFSLPTLTEQESLLLTLAQQYLQNLLPASVMKSMGGFFQQARSNLDPYTSQKLESEWLSKVRVVHESQPLLPPVINSGVFEAVSTALYQNRWLVVDYKNAEGKQAERNVMRLGLAQQGPRLYLVCRYEGYDNERSLAIHRIKRATVSGISFKRPPEFSLQKYDDDGRFGFGEGQYIKLSFCIAKTAGQHLLETLLSKDQRAVECDDYYIITATVIDSARLDWWLNGFGEQVWDVKKNP